MTTEGQILRLIRRAKPTLTENEARVVWRRSLWEAPGRKTPAARGYRNDRRDGKAPRVRGTLKRTAIKPSPNGTARSFTVSGRSGWMSPRKAPGLHPLSRKAFVERAQISILADLADLADEIGQKPDRLRAEIDQRQQLLDSQLVKQPAR